MKRFENLILLLLVSLFFCGCSHYINQLHRSFDKQLGRGANKNKGKDAFSLYRKRETQNQRISTSSHRSVYPAIKRNYVSTARKRYKAEDLRDNQNDGSLWKSGKNKDAFFFAGNNQKLKGDIVLIEVRRNLKNIITAELKRAFPYVPSKTTATGAGRPPAAGNAQAQANQNPANQNNDGNDEKIYDRISSVVIEEINRDHFLLKGRKSLIYQDQKRLIEIQSLVSKNDITENGTINSDRIVESNVAVIRQ